MLIRKDKEIPSSEITPKDFYLNRRKFLVRATAAGAALAVGPWPGLVSSVSSPSGEVRYTATRGGGVTTVKATNAVLSARVVLRNKPVST